MSKNNIATAACSHCGTRQQITYYSLINVAADPSLKEKVLDGSLFIWECPDCGTRNLISAPAVYLDPAARLLIICSADEIGLESPAEGEFSDYTIRQVREIGSLIELVKINDAGLDDEVIDLCRKVTQMEMKKDISLKFLRLEGADNEIIFTFPQNGQMEMIAIGFNVYEDCRAIIDAHRR